MGTIAVLGAIAVVPMSGPDFKMHRSLSVSAVRSNFIVNRCPEKPRKPPIKTHGMPYLIGAGRRAFPAFHVLFSNPNTTAGEITFMLEVLQQTGHDPAEFAPVAAAMLYWDDQLVQREALKLLARIGEPKHAKLVLPLLDDSSLRSYALAVLDRTAEFDELTALTEWWHARSNELTPRHLLPVEQSIHRIQKRLAATP